MRTVLLGAILLVSGLTGCIGSDDPAVEPTSLQAADARTLETPPDLQVGEWWTLQVDGDTSYATFETTLVVAHRTDETVTVGVPESDFSDAMQIIHLPPLGLLDRETLSWHVMFDRIQPLSFPLEPGRQWETQFHGAELTAEVIGVEDGTATVTMTGPNERIELTYDARIGMITSFEPDSYGTSFEVTDHGFGYEGTVQAPTGKALGFLEARLGPLDGSMAAAGPVETIEVDQDVSHASLALFTGGVTPTGQNAGAYRGSVTAPDGTNFEHTFTPTGEAGFLAVFFRHDAVQGSWQLELETAGPGFIGAELITYNLAEITLGGDGRTSQDAVR